MSWGVAPGWNCTAPVVLNTCGRAHSAAKVLKHALLPLLALLALSFPTRAAVTLSDQGKGCDYMTGEPIVLPAAGLSTNLFGSGAQVIMNRSHVARPAEFDLSGRLQYMHGEPTPLPASGAVTKQRASDDRAAKPLASLTAGTGRPENAPHAKGFPAYLEGQPYVWFLQDVRHYTNYACTVKVDQPATFYLLVDNRVNDYLPESSHDDPVFGPPDTQWMRDDGWKRVNTGLTPVLTPTNAGDYVGIDEGNNGTINQAYAVYAKTLAKPGSVTLRTELDGNIYCLVISTNPPPASVNDQSRPKAPAAGD